MTSELTQQQLEQLRSGGIPLGRRVELSTELIMRESTGPAGERPAPQ